LIFCDWVEALGRPFLGRKEGIDVRVDTDT